MTQVETCVIAEEIWRKFEAKFKNQPTNRARKLAMRRLYAHSDGCLTCRESGKGKPYGLSIIYYPWERKTTLQN